MRYLAWVSFPFAFGCVLCAYARLPLASVAVAAGVLVLLGVLFAALKRARLRAVPLVLCGLAAGLLFTASYRALIYRDAPAPEGETGILTGTVCGMPAESATGGSVLLRIERGGRTVKARLYMKQARPELLPGDCVSVRAQLCSVSDDAASELYYGAKGIRFVAYERGEFSSGCPDSVPLRDRPARWRAAVGERIALIFPADTEGFLRALLIGGTEGLTEADSAALRATGVFHVVSVSGMHVSILLGFLLFAFRGRLGRAAIGIPAAAIFVAFIGGTPGVMRAGIMYAIALCAPLLRREPDTPTALGAALLAMLACNPLAVADVGLQLSFAATAGILLLYTRMDAALRKLCRVDALRAHCRPAASAAAFLLGVLATTLSALIFTVPLLAYWYGTISIIAPLANVLIVPVVSACFVIGLLAVAAAFVWLPGAAVLAWVDSWPVRYVLGTARLLARVPYAQVSALTPYLLIWLLFAYVVIVLMIAQRPLRARPVVPICSLLLTLALSLLGTTISRAPRSCTVTALDVGQGQCIVFETGGLRAVVDCGGNSNAGAVCAQYLLDGGGRTLDALVLTHFDSDHVSGVPYLLGQLSVTAVYLPEFSEDAAARETIVSAALEAGTAVYTVLQDAVLSFTGGSLTVFAPVAYGGDNEAGLSALLSVGEFDALVTGDMDTALENRLLALHELPDLEVLVAGHHGSRYSTGETLLAGTLPEIVLISVGDNHYGHPADEVLARIAAIGATAYRTDECGSITVRR